MNLSISSVLLVNLSLALSASSLAVLAPAAHAGPRQQQVTLHVSNFPPDWLFESGQAEFNADSVTADGQQVLLKSYSTPPGYPAIKEQTYVRDMISGEFETISVNDSGEPANENSSGSSLSSQGRYAVFMSGATNLSDSPPPPLYYGQFYIRDRVAKTTRCITQNAAGEYGNGNTGLGRFSPDERFVIFQTYASNLVPEDTNNFQDIFVYDIALRTVERVNVSPTGQEANGGSGIGGMSHSGRFVAFGSAASNLIPGVGNGMGQAFVLDRETNERTIVSKNALGELADYHVANVHISGDGRIVAFACEAMNLYPGTNFDTQIYTFDRVTSELRCVTVSPTGVAGDDDSLGPVLSTDGRFMSFVSTANNLIPGFAPPSYNIYRAELLTNKIECVSVSMHGGYANHQSTNSCINADGRFVVFRSLATNLEPTGGEMYPPDVYIRDMSLGATPKVYCLSTEGTAGCLPSMSFAGTPSVSAGSGFTLTTTNLRNQKSGLLFYGTTASQLTLIPAGWLCIQPPLVRTNVQSSGGSSGTQTDCSGSLQLDFNSYTASGIDPALVAGQAVWCQTWSREPDLPATSYLSDAVVFTLGP